MASDGESSSSSEAENEKSEKLCSPSSCKSKSCKTQCAAKQQQQQQVQNFQKQRALKNKKCHQQKYITTKSPAVDFIETEWNYNIAVELPGVTKDSIDIELENGFLTVSTGATVETKVVGKEKQQRPAIENSDSDNTTCNQEQEQEDGVMVDSNNSTNVDVESLVDEDDAFSGKDVEAENLAKALGEKRRQQQHQQQDQMDTDNDNNNNSNSSKNYVYKHIERGVRKYKRTFKLDKRVSSQSITASYENGILQLTIAKPVKKSPERISIM